MATLTITVPDDQVPRIMAATGATDANDVRQLLINYVKDIVRNYEQTAGQNTLREQYLADKAAYTVADLDVT